MTINYTSLKNEFQNDPLSLGYSGQIAIGNDTGLAVLINSLTGSGTASIFRNDVLPKEVVNVIQPGDFAGASQIAISKLNLLFIATPIDVTLSGVRANFQNIFSGTATLNSGFLGSIATRTGSRAEVLFGPGTNVTSQDVSKAFGRV